MLIYSQLVLTFHFLNVINCFNFSDNLAGAACATGDGDEIMKFCPCFHVVQLMKQGATPADACRQVILDIRTRIDAKDAFEIGIIAMNMQVAVSFTQVFAI